MRDRTEKEPFHPRDRGQVADPAAPGPLHSVRPVPYLGGLRCLGVPSPGGALRAASSRDHALLETLLAAARQTDPTLVEAIYAVPTPALLFLLGPTGRIREVRQAMDRLVASDWTISDEAAFRPVVSWSENGGDLHFALAPVLRSLLGRPVGYGTRYRHLDLREMWRFGSGCTTPLYRHLLAATPAPRGSPERHVVEMTWDEVAEICGLRRQKTGGWRNQIEAAVLKPVRIDLCGQDDKDGKVVRHGLDPNEITIEPSWREGKSFADRVTFTVSRPLAPFERIRSKRLVYEKKVWENGVEGVKKVNLGPEARWVLDRPDAFPYKVSLTAWVKIARVLNLNDIEQIHFSLAFDYAIDEMLNADDPRYGQLTPGATTRPYRRERLMAAIEEVGADRACALFCCEEFAFPDLTHPETRHRLEFDRTKYFVTADRQERRRVCKAIEKRRLRVERETAEGRPARRRPPIGDPQRVDRSGACDAEVIAVEMERWRRDEEESEERDRALAESRAAGKARREREKRDRHNARRREKRSVEKEDRAEEAAWEAYRQEKRVVDRTVDPSDAGEDPVLRLADRSKLDDVTGRRLVQLAIDGRSLVARSEDGNQRWSAMEALQALKRDHRAAGISDDDLVVGDLVERIAWINGIQGEPAADIAIEIV